SLSARRQRQILAVLLGAFALLAAASVATFHRPPIDSPPWQAENACGPVGAVLAWGLAWTLGHAAAFLVRMLAGVWAWNRVGVHGIGALMQGGVVRPAQGAGAAYGTWQESRAEALRPAAKQRAKDEKDARRRPARTPVAGLDGSEAQAGEGAPASPRISGRP